jgi:hypothetical protein
VAREEGPTRSGRDRRRRELSSPWPLELVEEAAGGAASPGEEEPNAGPHPGEEEPQAKSTPTRRWAGAPPCAAGARGVAGLARGVELARP